MSFTQEVRNDSFTDVFSLNVRSFDTTLFNQFRQSDEFQYDTAQPAPTLYQRLMDWLTQGMRRNNTQTQNFWRVLGIVIAVLAILLLIFTMLNVKTSSIFAKNSHINASWKEKDEEEILGAQIIDQINEAISKENYRLAIRLQYLNIIKTLSERGFIKWRPNKTNNDYIKELGKTDFVTWFKELARYYEFVWYGDFPVDVKTYHSFNELYKNYEGKIKNYP